jgi:hypothetical protein
LVVGKVLPKAEMIGLIERGREDEMLVYEGFKLMTLDISAWVSDFELTCLDDGMMIAAKWTEGILFP